MVSIWKYITFAAKGPFNSVDTGRTVFYTEKPVKTEIVEDFIRRKGFDVIVT